MTTRLLCMAVAAGLAAGSFLPVPTAHAQMRDLADAASLARTLADMGESAEEEAAAEPEAEPDTAAEAAAAAGAEASGEASEDPDAPKDTLEDSVELASQTCIQAGEQDKAASIALLFGGDGENKGLVDEDISQYLVGLCVPDDFDSQFRLNQYLLVKGSYYSFYAERGLEELAAYLAESGVELGIKAEALQKDRKLKKKLGAENDLDKAGYMLDREETYSENAELFVAAIAELEDEQREEALRLAGIARGHALNATFFLARGLYVSKEMSGAMAGNAGAEASALVSDANRGSSSPLQAAEVLVNRLPFGKKKKASPTVQFGTFVAKNGDALVDTLTNVSNVTKTFDTKADEIPQLSQAELDEDANRLNDEWDLPDEFADEDAYAENNTLGS